MRMDFEWPTVPLGPLTTLISSGVTPKGGAEVYLPSGPVMLIRSQNVQMNCLSLEDVAFITDEIDNSMSRSRITSGDVLLNITGASIGRVTTFDLHDTRANVNQHVCVIRPKPEVLFHRYLSYLISSPSFQLEIERLQHGGTRQALTFGLIAEFKIPLPPLAEQRRIAAILDQAETLRAKRRHALAQLDTLTQSLFLDLCGDPATNPKGWRKKKMESIATKITDGEHLTPKRTPSGIKLLSARNVRNGFLDFTEVDFVDEAEYLRIKKRCNPEFGDILISCSGTIGRVTTVETHEPFSLVRSVALVKPNVERVLSKYLEHYLRTPFLFSLMQRSANASSQANLFQGPIRELPVLVPDLGIQEQFAAQVAAVERLKAAQRASLAKLDALFASLQHRVFRGEL